MKRNLAAIRDVLLHVERNVRFTGRLQRLAVNEIVSDCTSEEVDYAVYLTIDKGLLDGVWDVRNPRLDGPFVRAITDSGYEALESIRNAAG